MEKAVELDLKGSGVGDPRRSRRVMPVCSIDWRCRCPTKLPECSPTSPTSGLPISAKSAYTD
mgnify:CR=1 FL=1